MTPEEAAKKFGTLVGTFGTTWSPRTNLREQEPADQRTSTDRKGMDPHQRTPPQPDDPAEEWTYTRAVFLRTLHRFPDALDAIRQALADLRRRCPKELYEPG